MSSFTLEPSISCPVIHDDDLALGYMAEMERTGELKGAFSPHPDLTIITAHNYTEESLLERNLRHLGLHECCEVIQPPAGMTWRNTVKIELYQVLNRFFLSHCTGPGGAGGRESASPEALVLVKSMLMASAPPAARCGYRHS